MSPSRRLNPLPQSPVGELALSLVDTHAAGAQNEDSPLQLSSLKGSVVVLFVLGIDCGTCKQVARSLASLHNEYWQEVSFVGVCVQSGCSERLGEFSQGAKVPFPLAHCSTRELYPALGISKGTWLFFPTMIFLDRKHRLRGLFIGGDEFFEDVASSTRRVLDDLSLEAPTSETCSEVNA